MYKPLHSHGLVVSAHARDATCVKHDLSLIHHTSYFSC